jgi:hypothetical protein
MYSIVRNRYDSKYIFLLFINVVTKLDDDNYPGFITGKSISAAYRSQNSISPEEIKLPSLAGYIMIGLVNFIMLNGMSFYLGFSKSVYA